MQSYFFHNHLKPVAVSYIVPGITILMHQHIMAVFLIYGIWFSFDLNNLDNKAVSGNMEQDLAIFGQGLISDK